MLTTHEVIRPYPGSGLSAGSLVDASSWRNTRQLERLRYLRKLPAAAPAGGPIPNPDRQSPKKHRGR